MRRRQWIDRQLLLLFDICGWRIVYLSLALSPSLLSLDKWKTQSWYMLAQETIKGKHGCHWAGHEGMRQDDGVVVEGQPDWRCLILKIRKMSDGLLFALAVVSFSRLGSEGVAWRCSIYPPIYSLSTINNNTNDLTISHIPFWREW